MSTHSSFGEHFVDNQEACPKTWALLKDIPGLTTANLILRPDTEIHPHTDHTRGTKIPFRSRFLRTVITVCGRDQWEQGKILIFDDTQEHLQIGDRDRVVLLFTLEKIYEHLDHRTLGGQKFTTKIVY